MQDKSTPLETLLAERALYQAPLDVIIVNMIPLIFLGLIAFPLVAATVAIVPPFAAITLSIYLVTRNPLFKTRGKYILLNPLVVIMGPVMAAMLVVKATIRCLLRLVSITLNLFIHLFNSLCRTCRITAEIIEKSGGSLSAVVVLYIASIMAVSIFIPLVISMFSRGVSPLGLVLAGEVGLASTVKVIIGIFMIASFITILFLSIIVMNTKILRVVTQIYMPDYYTADEVKVMNERWMNESNFPGTNLNEVIPTNRLVPTFS